MAISFYATNVENNFRNADYINYADEIHDYLYNLSLYDKLPEGLIRLINLDHYKIQELSSEEIDMIISGIDEVLDEEYDVQIMDFLRNLYAFLEDAIEKEKLIYSVGE